jgi:membrane dipeptidase
VGMGTDGGTSKIDLDVYKANQAKEDMKRRAAGIATPGEAVNTLNFIPELSGPGQFRTLAGLLAARGYSTARIEKVLGLNFQRFARQVWGA